ncbi:PAS-domain containing protein [Tritonibacter litoralis]
MNMLINPEDSLERQNEKLLRIVETLMRRVEQDTDASGLAYTQFQRAVMLEEEVRSRTQDLERALDLLNQSNAALTQANRETEAARSNLANAIETVQEGFALFNSQEELVMCNSRFGMHMPDIRSHFKPGLPFEAYVDHVSRSRFLALPRKECPRDWAAKRMERHRDVSVIFNVRLIGNRWVQVSEHRTSDGGTVILQTDVSDIMRLERKERERLLDDQSRLIQATLEHLKQGVCMFDAPGRLVGWNRRIGELLSIPASRFHIGSRFETIFSQLRRGFAFLGQFSGADLEEWVNGSTGRSPLTFEIRGSDDRFLTVFLQEMPDGGFVISFTDITAERQAIRTMTEAKETLEQRVLERTLELQDALSDAERANASKSRFVAAASHDLLQPLSAAKLYLATVEQEVPQDRARGLLNKAGSALQSVESILEALLDISKLDSKQASVHISAVPLQQILRQLRDELAHRAVEKGLDFRVLPTSAVVMSDPTYLRRILQNLISNALRYTDRGKVLVGVRRLGNRVRVEVWDTGPGIDETEHNKIFTEFHRVHATASAADGLGLGLAIVERACRLLNHPICLESALGRGTMFSVELPRAKEKWATPLPEATRAPVGEEDAFLDQIILLIENDNDLRNALSITIENWGASVLPCRGEQEAFDLLEEIGVVPDFIVADVQLDDGKLGSDAIANLRRRYGYTPACLITANRGMDLDTVAADLGAKILYKPFAPEELRAVLEDESSA